MAANDGHSEAPAKQAPAGGRRDGRGRFPKGTSGNPRGRQPRGLATVERLRTALAEELPAIIRSVVEKAKAGDIGASKLILERLLPPLRSSEVTVVLDGVTGTRTDQGQAILQAWPRACCRRRKRRNFLEHSRHRRRSPKWTSSSGASLCSRRSWEGAMASSVQRRVEQLEAKLQAKLPSCPRSRGCSTSWASIRAATKK